MSDPVQRRLEVAEIGDVTVVNFVDRKIVDDQSIRSISEQLMRLIDQEGRKRIVLHFGNVEYTSSKGLGGIWAFGRKVQKSGGRVVLCNVRPQIYEVFEITRSVTFFPIVKEMRDALDTFDLRALEATCPVHDCRAWVFSMPSLAFAAPSYHATWQEKCPACFATASTSIEHLPGAEGVEGKVRRMSLPTAEGEAINVSLEPPMTSGSFAPGDVYRIEVVGRLDQSAAQVLERGWLSLPRPRRAVFDLRAATALSEEGTATLTRLCTPEGQFPPATILIETKKEGLFAPLAAQIRVHPTAAEAILTLGPLPEVSHSPIVVTVRPFSPEGPA